MLRFVMGGSGSGKSHYIKQKIVELVNTTDKKIILLVPEQFSFESEREMFRLLGAKSSKRVMVVSFTRLADMIFRTYGGMAGKVADNTKKLVFMEIAVAEMYDSFKYYKKAAGYKSFSVNMLSAIEEIKSAGISPEQIIATAAKTGIETLCEKTEEICNLYKAYQAILEKSCVDPSDKLVRASERVKDKQYFKDSTVVFDEFKSFTGNQKQLIRQIIRDAEDCYFALCTDGSKSNLYYVVDDTVMRLKAMAREQGIKVASSVVLDTGKRFKSEQLSHLERNLFSIEPQKFNGELGYVQFAVASCVDEEVEYILSKIRNLVRNDGYRYKDFAIIPANGDAYLSTLASSMKKYEIPYYTDASQGIKTSPIIRFVISLLNLSFGGFDIDTVFTLLKCGYAPFSDEQISGFENYCFTWGIKGSSLKNEFTGNPNGFSDTFGDLEKQQLLIFNSIRVYILNSIEKIKYADNSTASEIGKALFETLEQLGISTKTEQMIKSEETDILTSQNLTRVWEILLEILDSIAVSAGEYRFKIATYTDLFVKACEQNEMGTVPQTLDAVTVGAMDRIRMDSVKVAYILGANKGEFPATVHMGGVFSNLERNALNDAGLDISKPFEYILSEQKFNAYKMLSMPRDRVYISASKYNEKGDALLLSEIFKTATEIFSKDIIENVSELPPSFFCKTEKTTFEMFAKNIRREDSYTASMRQVLSESPIYRRKIKLLENVSNQACAQLVDKANINGIFPEKINVSPSGLERFYQCKFKFFCANGLGVSPLKHAELNPMQTGSLIHYALEGLASDKEFSNYSESELKQAIKKLLDEYLDQVMSGEKNKTAQFKYLYSRLTRTILDIALHLQAELAQSEFYPSDFELQIANDSEVKPLKLLAEDGTQITVAGRVDRVDIATKNGKKYVRVIDYKSGNKKFNLSDIYYGLNMQMLVYLFCIWKNGSGKYIDSIPGGVLYMPACGAENTLGRNDNKILENEKQKQYKMNGILLNDVAALTAMESDLSGVFIPAKMKKDGTFDRYSTLASLAEMGKLYEYTEKMFKKMVLNLRGGAVEACPIEDNSSKRFACEWCDYRSVCGVEDNDRGRRMLQFDNDKIHEMIAKEEESDE